MCYILPSFWDAVQLEKGVGGATPRTLSKRPKSGGTGGNPHQPLLILLSAARHGTSSNTWLPSVPNY